jgi:hypothetical protein
MITCHLILLCMTLRQVILCRACIYEYESLISMTKQFPRFPSVTLHRHEFGFVASFTCNRLFHTEHPFMNIVFHYFIKSLHICYPKLKETIHEQLLTTAIYLKLDNVCWILYYLSSDTFGNYTIRNVVQ